MNDPFVARQIAYVGAVLVGVGLVGCAVRRDGATFSRSVGLVMQGLVLVAVGLVGPMAGREQMLFLLLVAGGVLYALVAGLVGNGGLLDDEGEQPSVVEVHAPGHDDEERGRGQTVVLVTEPARPATPPDSAGAPS